MEPRPDPPTPARRGPPTGVRLLRWFGFAGMALFVLTAVVARPGPGLVGDGPAVLAAIVALVAGVVATLHPRLDAVPVRFAGLLAIAAAAVALIVLQGEQSAAVAGIYFAAIMAAVRLPRVLAGVVVAAAVVGGALAYALDVPGSEGQVIGILLGIPPWFVVVRTMREIRARHVAAERLVDELRESRAARAEASAQAERGRLARDMHDVLAHSLSALALQLEGARLLALDRNADRAVVDAVVRAHRLATSGLDEARRAIGALRGEELPGPERLEALAEAFAAQTSADCRVTVEGPPRELGSEARLALYRTAQEALTNVRRHSAATSVEVRLAYADDGVALSVEDHGPGAPVAVGGGSGGYGLTGMRERAELLGGSLEAGPTDDGFRVALWLPT